MIKLSKLNKYYDFNTVKQYHVLKEINLEFDSEEFVVILGESGSGKTTLLNVIGGLDDFQSGKLIINNILITNNDKTWENLHKNNFGFIFQKAYLIEELSLIDNVALPLVLQGVSRTEAREKAQKALDDVDLSNKGERKPYELSGGEKQRVTIARAIIHDPEIILADEPTASLDSKTSKLIMDILNKISRNRLVIMITHDEDLIQPYATRSIRLIDGVVVDDNVPKSKLINDNHTLKEINNHVDYISLLHISYLFFRSNFSRYRHILFSYIIGFLLIFSALFFTTSAQIQSEDNLSNIYQTKFIEVGKFERPEHNFTDWQEETYNEDDVRQISSIEGVEFAELSNFVLLHNNFDLILQSLISDEYLEYQINSTKINGNMPNDGEILLNETAAISLKSQLGYENIIGKDIEFTIDHESTYSNDISSELLEQFRITLKVSGIYESDNGYYGSFGYATKETVQSLVGTQDIIRSLQNYIERPTSIFYNDGEPILFKSDIASKSFLLSEYNYNNTSEINLKELSNYILYGESPDDVNEVMISIEDLPYLIKNNIKKYKNITTDEIEALVSNNKIDEEIINQILGLKITTYIDNIGYNLKIVGMYKMVKRTETMFIDGVSQDLHILYSEAIVSDETYAELTAPKYNKRLYVVISGANDRETVIENLSNLNYNILNDENDLIQGIIDLDSLINYLYVFVTIVIITLLIIISSKVSNHNIDRRKFNISMLRAIGFTQNNIIFLTLCELTILYIFIWMASTIPIIIISRFMINIDISIVLILVIGILTIIMGSINSFILSKRLKSYNSAKLLRERE